MNRWLAFATLLALAPLASCGSSSVVITNPCAYASAAEVGPIVGGPVAQGQVVTGMSPQTGQTTLTCVFHPQGSYAVAIPGSNAGFEFAAITFLDQHTFDQSVAARPFRSVRRVPFGDAAFEVGAPHYEMLFVRKGGYSLGFEVAAGLGSFFGPEEALARVVVARLPA